MLPPRQNLRTITYFIFSLFLVPAFCILVANKSHQHDGSGESLSSIGFYQYTSSISLASFPPSSSAASSIVKCDTTTTTADFILVVITVLFGYLVVTPTLIAVYLNCDVRSYAALDRAKQLSIFTAVVMCLFSALMLCTVIVTYLFAERDVSNSNTNNNNDQSDELALEWPWPLYLVSCILFSLSFVPWSIRRAVQLDAVKIEFPEDVDDDGEQQQQHQEHQEEKNEPFQEEEQQKTESKIEMMKPTTSLKSLPAIVHKREQVLFEAATLSFYGTRTGLGRLMLWFVCLMSLMVASTFGSTSWISSTTTSTTTKTHHHHSPLFGTCTSYSASIILSNTTEFCSNIVSSTASASANYNSTSSSSSSSPTFSSIYLGLNATNLVFALFLIIGTVLQWTWCLVPLSFIGCIFSCAVVGVGVDRLLNADDSTSILRKPCLFSNGESPIMIELGWVCWLQVATAIVWLLNGIAGIVLQLCVSDGTEEELEE